MEEAGHTLSSREAYLGIQDALRKLRAAGGTFYPGAWAGVVVFNDEKLGLVVLTSQEKWDKLKSICNKWLMRLEAGELDLDHIKLRPDKGFMVHVTHAYPTMKPYMKGFICLWKHGETEEMLKVGSCLPGAGILMSWSLWQRMKWRMKALRICQRLLETMWFQQWCPQDMSRVSLGLCLDLHQT